MQICLVTQQYKEVKSGVGVYATNVVNGLRNRGHKVIVITPLNRENRSDVRFIFAAKFPFDLTPNKWFSFSRNAAQRYKILKNKPYDIIHFTDAKEVLFFPRSKIPMVGNVNDCYLAIAPKSPFYYRKFYSADWVRRYVYYNSARVLEKRALSKLTAVISNSEFVSTNLSQFYGISKNKIEIIYKSIDLAQFRMPLKGKKVGKPVILFVGGNFQRKGLPLLIKGAPKVLKRYPSAQFYVIGNDPNMGKIKRLCQKKGVEKAFRFLGHVDNEKICNYYKTADVFAMPSLVEAFGVVFLEAMASGTPVIGSKVGGTKELIKHGKNGLLVNPNKPNQLAEYILKLLHDRKLRAKIVREGYKTVKNYDVNNMIDETIGFYNKLLDI